MRSFQRALMMISAAYPEISIQNLPSLSLGQRDALLLALRKSLFGPHIVGIASCKGCTERLEIAFDVDEVTMDLPEDASEVMVISAEGFVVHFRLPNSSDLIEASGCRDTDSFRNSLLKSCLLKISRKAEDEKADMERDEAELRDLPEAVVGEIVAGMERADPQADVNIVMTCPVCQSEEKIAFDIISFLWKELNAWSVRTLREVHILASAYGWREADILAMSPWRRQFYLEVLER
ncbi:MAG TPA: hypothetical protein VN455_02075 [Methanotrichaceae archaeon]|nr:hypothetical protein [Methanotrichaceae archaeon]